MSDPQKAFDDWQDQMTAERRAVTRALLAMLCANTRSVYYVSPGVIGWQIRDFTFWLGEEVAAATCSTGLYGAYGKAKL